MRKRKCEFCGNSIDSGDIFCKGCGKKVADDDIVKDAIIEEDGKKVESNTFILVIIILILLGMVALGLYHLLFK